MATATMTPDKTTPQVKTKPYTRKQIERAREIVLEEGKLYKTPVEKYAVALAMAQHRLEQFRVVREGDREDGAVIGVIIDRLTPKDGWRTIGQVGVDSGSLLLCDPCYIVGKHKADDPNDPLSKFPTMPLAAAFDKTWMDFCDDTDQLYTQLNYGTKNGKNDAAGLGVVFDSGLGDGTYDVDARFSDGRIQEIRVKFFE